MRNCQTANRFIIINQSLIFFWLSTKNFYLHYIKRALGARVVFAVFALPPETIYYLAIVTSNCQLCCNLKITFSSKSFINPFLFTVLKWVHLHIWSLLPLLCYYSIFQYVTVMYRCDCMFFQQYHLISLTVRGSTNEKNFFINSIFQRRFTWM